MSFLNAVLEKIGRFLNKIFPAEEETIEDIEEDIWEALAEIYYKWDDKKQKRAFRNVVKKIAQLIDEDDWPAIWRILYKWKKDIVEGRI